MFPRPVIRAEEVKEGGNFAIINNAPEQTLDKWVAYDISLQSDGVEIQPDSEVVRAVVANLMAKLDPRRPDPYRDIPLLSPGRCAVYSVWTACNELSGGNFEGFFASPSACFAELAADGYDRIGAPRCGDILREALAAKPEQLRELNAAFSDAAEAEQPMTLCAEYIRDNPAEFVDSPGDDAVLPRETNELL